jgi:hypothetical protein
MLDGIKPASFDDSTRTTWRIQVAHSSDSIPNWPHIETTFSQMIFLIQLVFLTPAFFTVFAASNIVKSGFDKIWCIQPAVASPNP